MIRPRSPCPENAAGEFQPDSRHHPAVDHSEGDHGENAAPASAGQAGGHEVQGSPARAVPAEGHRPLVPDARFLPPRLRRRRHSCLQMRYSFFQSPCRPHAAAAHAAAGTRTAAASFTRAGRAASSALIGGAIPLRIDPGQSTGPPLPIPFLSSHHRQRTAAQQASDAFSQHLLQRRHLHPAKHRPPIMESSRR